MPFSDATFVLKRRLLRFRSVQVGLLLASLSFGIGAYPVNSLGGPLRKKPDSGGNSGILRKVFRADPPPSSKPSVSKPPVSRPNAGTRNPGRITKNRSNPRTSLDPVERVRPAQPRIFILGDSQGFTDFGPSLRKELVSHGYEVLYHAVKNGTPYYWSGLWSSPVLTRVFPPAASPEDLAESSTISMSPSTIENYAKIYAPDIFVVQAGTNFEVDLARDNPAQISKLIEDCLEAAEAEGARVLWIGPPDARDDVRTPEFQKLAIKTLEEALSPWSESQGRSCFFDSRPVCPMSNRTRGDGEHPENQLARDWAVSAAKWVDESAKFFLSRKMLRCQDSRKEKEKAGFSMRVLDSGFDPVTSRTIKAKLRLSGKSIPEKIETLPYTDAFSVYRYELMNPDEIYGADRLLTTNTEDPSRYWVYVLHWTVHNPGGGPRPTQMAGLDPGKICTLELARIEDHPLGDTLKTMPQFNHFDDFLAPIFVSKDIMQEVGKQGSQIASSAESP